jgi:competence protein ComFC
MIQKSKIKDFLLKIFFPKFCFSCQREGSYLCPDCSATLDILESNFCLCENPSRLPAAGKCFLCQKKSLNGLYFAVSYKNNLIKTLIHRFKYEPYIKELATSLACLIIAHFNLIQKVFSGENFIIVPVPLTKKKLKKRGFNQSEEIAKELAKNLSIPLLSDCLIKEKETPAQMELKKEARQNNLKGVFSISDPGRIRGKKILLVDDVYTTGSTMQECASVLKKAGSQEVWGVAIARGE